MTFEMMMEQYENMKSVCEEQLIKLQSEHSKTDKKIVDIQHEIEFGNYDAFTMINVFKDLKNTLKIRRTVKKEITKLHNFKIIFKDHKYISKSCEGLEKRKYNPRILKLDFTDNKTLIRSRKMLLEI